VADRYRAVRSRAGRTVHLAPIGTPVSRPDLLNRVTLCQPLGQAGVRFYTVAGDVSCVLCKVIRDRG
jgi:hypothetical protein